MKKTLIVLATALSMMGGAFAYGVHKGKNWEQNRNEAVRQELQQEIFDLADSLIVKNAELLQLIKKREGLINELENQAMEAIGADNPGVATTGGLRRLERRWSESPTTP